MKKRPTRPTPLSPASTGGFSLVEVTLALGLVAFVLVSLLGLTSVGLKASRSSAEKTSLSQTVDYAFSTGLSPMTSGSSRTLYFSSEGLLLSGATDAYYTATLSAQTAADSDTAAGGLLILKLEVTWPGASETFYSTALAPL